MNNLTPCVFGCGRYTAWWRQARNSQYYAICWECAEQKRDHDMEALSAAIHESEKDKQGVHVRAMRKLA